MSTNWLRDITILFVLSVHGCGDLSPRGWQQDVYVWSRSQEPSTLEVPSEIGNVRVLVAEWSRQDASPWKLSGRPSTQLGGHPFVAVARLDGLRLSVPPADVAATLAALLAELQPSTGWFALEIDHDSATSRLPEYAVWLAEFKTAWGDRTPLWITALPDWRRSAVLGDLLKSVDQYTLQVHAVDARQDQLVNLDFAMNWVRAYEAKSNKPHFVALPTYGSRLGRSADGSIRFIESESLLGRSAMYEQSYVADPVELAALAGQLSSGRIRSRLGVAWFRLPDAQSDRVLSMSTFEALLRGETPQRKLIARSQPTARESSNFDLSLENPGPYDVALPRVIRWEVDCVVGDLAADFAEVRQGTLERKGEALIRPNSTVVVGWMRCAPNLRPKFWLSW